MWWKHKRAIAIGLVSLGTLMGCGGDGETSTGSQGSAGSSTAGGGNAGGSVTAQGGNAANGAAGSAGSSGPGPGGTGGQAGAGQAGASDCERLPGPDDYVRKVVVSHLFDEHANKATTYEVLELSTNGMLSKTGQTFEMGTGEQVPIAFTPDGKIGISVQDDGSLGVFRFDDQGQVHVVHDRFKGSLYASRVVMARNGRRAYVLSTQWAEHGGGVYVVSIGCDGTLTEQHKVMAAKMPFAMALLPNSDDEALLASQDVLGSQPSDLVHLVDLKTPARIASLELFPNSEAYIGSLALSEDGTIALLGDTAQYNDVPNRIGVARIQGSTLSNVQVLADIEDPFSIQLSPFANTALVVSGFGDAIFVLDWDASNPSAPFHLRGKLSYVGDGPKVPGDSVQIMRGTLRGLVLISDYTGIRRVRFNQSDEGIEDLGRFDLGTGTESLTGAVGVQP